MIPIIVSVAAGVSALGIGGICAKTSGFANRTLFLNDTLINTDDSICIILGKGYVKTARVLKIVGNISDYLSIINYGM